MARTEVRLVNGERYARALAQMSANAKRDFSILLEAEGMSLLDLVQQKIIALQAVDYRRLLNSFDKGSQGNVWELSNGGLTLTVGTNVKYAQAVNDGHWTVKNKFSRIIGGRKARWVPGVWSGNRFIYRPGADEGMLLKEKFIQGKPYWDQALNMFEAIFNQEVEEWFKNRVHDWERDLS
jgi:hypothetical protein